MRNYYFGLITLISSASVFAFAPYAERLPSTVDDLDGLGLVNCQTCHVNTNGGSPWNLFGQEVQSQGSGGPTWADLCSLDSDGDGKTNGEELGDPDCEWSEDDDFATEAIGQPGVPECDGEIVDFQTDNNNCGECGFECPTLDLEECVEGECVLVGNTNDGTPVEDDGDEPVAEDDDVVISDDEDESSNEDGAETEDDTDSDTDGGTGDADESGCSVAGSNTFGLLLGFACIVGVIRRK